MPIVHTSLSAVLERFPELTHKIKRLFKQDRTFQEQCEDYRRCCRALEYWCRSDTQSAPSRREDYTELLKELETEILQRLDESE